MKDAARYVEDLARQAREESIGSIDPGTNARAIALGSEIVRERLRSALDTGGKLRSVSAASGFGYSPNDFALVFDLALGDPDPTAGTRFIAWIDLPARAVKRITDELPQQFQPTAPFSLMVPSAAPLIKTPVENIAAKRLRELQFIERLNIRELFELLRKKGFNLPVGEGYGDTEYDTPVRTQVESGTTTTFGTTSETGGTADDTQPDSQYDSLPETVADTETDYRIDTI